MPLTSLTAISPLDGRYAHLLDDLRSVCSEFGLIRARVQVEVAWCQRLFACPTVPAGNHLSASALAALDIIASASFKRSGSSHPPR